MPELETGLILGVTFYGVVGGIVAIIAVVVAVVQLRMRKLLPGPVGRVHGASSPPTAPPSPNQAST